MTLRGIFLIPVLASLAVSARAEGSHSKCPPFGTARCYGQQARGGGDCGGHPAHSLAYALRVAHLDYDPMSGLLFNPGTADLNDHKKWQWFEAPDPEDIDAWCLEDCEVVRAETDPRLRNAPCTEAPARAAAPPSRPPYPWMIRCFGGDDYTGGQDYSKFPLCGAPPGVTAAGVFPVPSFRRKPIRLQTPPAGPSAEQLRNCTGGNPNCICVKGIVRFNRYEHAAHEATKRAFPGQDTKPEGMSDGEATAKICEAFNREPLLGPDSTCRSEGNDEIVLVDSARPVDPRYPAVSVDVVTAFGAFWRNSIAACKSAQ